MARALYVDNVQVMLTRSLPPRLLVHAGGRVSSSGWSDTRLEPFVYIAPPADGIMDFDLVATPPAGPSASVLSPICAGTSLWLPKWCKGVRIHASANKIEQLIPGRESEKSLPVWGGGESGSLPSGGPDSWPWLIAPEAQQAIDSLVALGAKSVKDGKISELLGRRMRIIRDGDFVDAMFDPERVTIMLARDSDKIIDIMFG